MTQEDLSLEFKRYHNPYEIETETAPRWLMVTVWSAVLVWSRSGSGSLARAGSRSGAGALAWSLLGSCAWAL